jgi:hypothetical protein
MELSRRDALAALVAAGVGATAGCSALAPDDRTADEEPPVGDDELATLVAVAEVVYPSAVSGVPEFVRTYTGGRVDDDGAYARGVAEAVGRLDGHATEFYDDRYAALSPATRRDALDSMSVDVADPVPDGTPAERVRHYVVDELLYALYTSPTGAGLAGLENPPGHPGGTTSYREPPG